MFIFRHLCLHFCLISYFFSIWLGCCAPLEASLFIRALNSKRSWRILSWNIRGINSEGKWDAIRSKVAESGCDIICLQVTKRESFDSQYFRNFCPPSFDSFEFIPSVGASRGSIIIWKAHNFVGSLAFQNSFGQSVEFVCRLTGEHWILTNIYAPCTPEGKLDFLNWFKYIEMPT
jgi:exonuclease III